jgi:hypothetical protein
MAIKARTQLIAPSRFRSFENGKLLFTRTTQHIVPILYTQVVV